MNLIKIIYANLFDQIKILKLKLSFRVGKEIGYKSILFKNDRIFFILKTIILIDIK